MVFRRSLILLCCGASLFFMTSGDIWDLNLHNDHVKYVFSNQPGLAKLCLSDEHCPYKSFSTSDNESCWGYEEGCDRKESFSKQEPRNCKSKHHKDDFWRRADFGYISNIRNELNQIHICEPLEPEDSSLVCSRNLRYCRAKDLFIDLRYHQPDRDRYKVDMFQQGHIGGRCKFNLNMLKEQHEQAHALQSWYSELQNYTNLDFQPLKDQSHCDVIFEKPLVFMKLDSGINLYHHFCDFFNLYLSQHVNNSWFNTDVQIIMWDTSSSGYYDIFTEAWKAFTEHPIIPLQEWFGKRVCIKHAMFALLPRMRGGLYYNTYIPDGCIGSSMFRAFSEHFLHRMGVTQDLPHRVNSTKIRVTLLERGKPHEENVYRKIKNQDQLVKVMEEFPDFEIKVVQYHWRQMTLVEQLKITHNSDIFIGMHGAGLLHFLFLPDWAVAFELYNCGDVRCYHDLARLRGLDYITWDSDNLEAFDQGKHQRYGDNPKFWNWSFDPNDFRRLIAKARKLLLANNKYKERWKMLNEDFQHNEL